MAHQTPTTQPDVMPEADDVGRENPTDAGQETDAGDETPKASASTQPAWELEEFPGLNEDQDRQKWDFADDGKEIPQEKIGFHKKRGFQNMTPEEIKKYKEEKRKDKKDKQPEKKNGWLDSIGTKKE